MQPVAQTPHGLGCSSGQDAGHLAFQKLQGTGVDI